MEKEKWTSSVFDSVRGKQLATPSEDFEKKLFKAIEAGRNITQPIIINMKWMVAAACAIIILITVNFLAVDNWDTKLENQNSNSNIEKGYSADNLIPNYDFLNESL